MIEREDIVAAVIDAGGGQLIGRVRLQKALYLLEQLGLGSGMPFEYHHYGPYSRELDNAMADAKTLGLINEQFEHRQSDGAMYSIFKLCQGTAIHDEVFARLGKEKVSALVHRFSKTNVTVLELAATIDWLWRSEHIPDWRSEVKKRKGKKVQGGHLEKAVELLKELALSPPAVGALEG
jgi:uncharacterized protein YwgA